VVTQSIGQAAVFLSGLRCFFDARARTSSCQALVDFVVLESPSLAFTLSIFPVAALPVLRLAAAMRSGR